MVFTANGNDNNPTMMYPYLLTTHSWLRWLVLASLVFAVLRALRGWFLGRPFSKTDHFVRHATATIAQVQLTLGLWLYCISPITRHFLSDYQAGVKIRELRFFGMEHSLMMFIAVALLTIGSMKAKRQTIDSQKFRAMAIWFSIALLVIFFSIPWLFSPVSPGRPYFRWGW